MDLYPSALTDYRRKQENWGWDFGVGVGKNQDQGWGCIWVVILQMILCIQNKYGHAWLPSYEVLCPSLASLNPNRLAIMAVLDSYPCLSFAISKRNSSLNLCDEYFFRDFGYYDYCEVEGLCQDGEGDGDGDSRREWMFAFSYYFQERMKKVSDLRPRQIRQDSEPKFLDQRFMQSNTRHQIFRTFRRSRQSLVFRDSFGQRDDDGVVRTCEVRIAQDSNSLQLYKNSQSIGRPSITFASRNCTCSIILLTLLVYRLFQSILIPFSIPLAFSLALLNNLMTVPASLFLSLLSIQQNKTQGSIWLEQYTFLTFQKSEREVLSALLYDLQSDPSFSLCRMIFSSYLNSYPKNRYKLWANS